MNGRKRPILHLEDWYNKDGKRTALVQIDTRNQTFLTMAKVLKMMGVKNHLFHLSLLDPTLLGVDPHALNDDNDPTMDMRTRVMVECRLNPWYFFREVCRIRAQGGNPVPFRLDRGNLAMLWCFFNNINFTSTQPRQTGKSICAVAICTYMLYIAGLHMDISMLTLNNKILQANVKRVRDIKDNLPKYFIVESPQNLNNKEGLYYAKLDTRYMTYCGQADSRAAGDVGRGASSPFIHFDEPPFTPNIDISYPVITSSTDAAKATAKAAGQYHANIFTTTAGDPSTTEGEFMFKIVNGAMKFTERLYDTKDEAAAHAMVESNSTNSLVNGTFSYLQLGLSHEWFAKKKREGGLTPSSIARDYLNQWIAVSDKPIITGDIARRMWASKKDDPTYIQVWGDYVIHWYVNRDRVLDGTYRKKTLVMGTDMSDMIGRDFTTCVAVDPEDLSVVFTFKCNMSNTSKFALFIADLLAEYSGIIFVPERKSTAVPIIDKASMVMQQNGQNPFRRIFNGVVNNLGVKGWERFDLNDPGLLSDDRARRHVGFITTGKTRPVLYKQVLFKAATMAADKLYDPDLIGEITSIQARNGRLDHSSGGHDDMVIAFLLACYFIFEAKNLTEYGLDPSKILRAVETRPGQNPAYIASQIALRKKIKTMIAQAKAADDEFLKKKILFDLERLTPMVDTSITVDPLSVDMLRNDDFEYRNIKNEIMNASKTPMITPTQLFQASMGRDDGYRNAGGTGWII